MQNYRGVQSESGVQFFGEVVNNGDGAAVGVEVFLTLADAAGGVVGSDSGSIYGTDVLEPGAKAVFLIRLSDPPAEWADETLQVTAEEVGDFYYGTTYTDLEASGVTVTPTEYGGLTIRGQVTNVGSEDVEYVQVVFVARDTDGSMLWFDNAYLGIDTLVPGNAGPFEIKVFEFEAPPAYDIIAQGSVYPE